MDYKLELVSVPVCDVDRAKRFYVDEVGFVLDHDHTVSDEIRFVQITPPGFGLFDRPRQGPLDHGTRLDIGAAVRGRRRAGGLTSSPVAGCR